MKICWLFAFSCCLLHLLTSCVGIRMNDVWKTHGKVSNRYLKKSSTDRLKQRNKHRQRLPNNKKYDDIQTAPGVNKLTDMLFHSYDKEVMTTRPVNVKLDILLLKVKSTVEREGIFETVIAIFVEWFDQRMIWDPEKYDNVTVLAIDPLRIWLPDIALTNSASHIYDISRDTQFLVRVTSNGIFRYVPTGTARTWCNLKLVTFPFDMQTCSLEFESWSLDSSSMIFQDSAHMIVDENFKSSQWELCYKNATVYSFYYEFTSETFSRIKFDLTVRRKSMFYVINLIFPCATLSVIQLLVFAIPSTQSSADRIGFGTTNLLTLVVFQTIATAEMPKTSDAVTALSKYIIALIMLSSIGIVESVAAERIRRITSGPPPDFLINLSQWHFQLWGLRPFHGGRSRLTLADVEQITVKNSSGSSSSSNSRRFSRESHENFENIPMRNKIKRSKTTIYPAKPTLLNGSVRAKFSLGSLYQSHQSQEATEEQEESYEDNTSTIARHMWHRHYGISFPKTSQSTKKPISYPMLMSYRSRKLRGASSPFTSAMENRARREFAENYYVEVWSEVAAIFDAFFFVISTFLAIFVPVILFIPLIYYGEEACSHAS